MKALRIVVRLGLLAGLGIGVLGLTAAGRALSPNEAQEPAPGLGKLTGDDAKRAEKLDKAIESALNADRWDEAIAGAEDLLALRAKAQSPRHYETAIAEWRVKTLRRVAPMSAADRAAYKSARGTDEQAQALHAQGKYAQAQPLFQNVLDVYRRLLGDEHPDTAGSYAWLAFNFDAQAKYAQAQPLFEKALATYRRLLTDDDPATAFSYDNLANNFSAQGKYAQAQPLYDKALEINRRLLGEEHADTARSFTNTASNLESQAKYVQAQPLFEKALEIFRQRLTDNHRDTALGYSNLAANLDAQGKHAQAQPLLEKALSINHRILTDDHPSTAQSYNSLALNLRSQGKHAEAQAIFEKALEICRRLLGENHPATAQSYNAIALNLEDQRKHAQAQPLFEKALEIRRRLLTEDHPLTAQSYNNAAMNLTDQGRYIEAQPRLERALEINRRLLTEDHPSTAMMYHNVAKNLSAQGKYEEARDRWIHAVKSLDATRLQRAFAGLERAAGSMESPRAALAAVLARLGQPAEAWQALEENLGRGLLDELAARQDHRLTPEERSRLHDLTNRLERLDRLVETTPRGLDQAERAQRFLEFEHQRGLASIALGELRAKLARERGPLMGEVATLSQVQATLPADAALVAWIDLSPPGPNAADPDGEHWGVVVRAKGMPTWAPIAGTGPGGLWTEDDVGLTNRVRMGLRRRPRAASLDLKRLIEKLRAQRLGPLAKALDATADGLPTARRLVILPSRALAGIPIEAVMAPDDTRTVSYSPSATVFKYLRQRPRPDRPGGLLALGDPVYEHSNIAERRKHEQVLAPARSGDEDFASLPSTRYEVEALARLFKSEDRPTRILLGTDASEPELDALAASGDLANFGFIHLATHGVVDEDIPTRSAVILTQTDLPDPLTQVLKHKPVFDGRLSVREIQRGWELKADPVTLSACETALGRREGGEGFVGFTQALLMSGTRSVCLSLWKVDDTATALLMQRFYANMLGRRRGLTDPMPKAEALHEAKTWLRGLRSDEALALTAELSGGVERGKSAKARMPAEPADLVPPGDHNDRPYASPHFWAAFVLAGDPD